MVRARIIFLMFCLASLSGFGFCDELRSIDPQEAAKHLRTKTDPAYPEMGKQLHVQGGVVLRIAISETGTVKVLGVVSGSPLLASSAIEAVRNWRYSPFLIEGKPAPVQSLVTVPFSLGDSPERIKQLEQINNQYFKAFDLCHRARIDRQLSQAEADCKKAVSLADQLDPARRLERVTAFGETGNTLFLQRRFAESLEYYQRELALAETFLTVNDNDLAVAQHHVGSGLWATGHLEEAARQYAKAENGFRQAREHIDSAFLKNEYSKGLKGVLNDHAALLRQMGHSDEADALKKQADAIVIKEGLKDN